MNKALGAGVGAALSPVLALVWKVLEFLIPTAQHDCFISFPDVDDNAYFLYREMLLSEEYSSPRLIWLVRDCKVARHKLKVRLKDNYSGAFIVLGKNTLRGFWCFLRAKRVFFTHGHYSFVRRSSHRVKLINLWHGMPIKVVGLLDDKEQSAVQATDITIASSDFFTSIMARAFGIPEGDVLVTGLPRCDALTAKTPAATSYLRSLFPESQKVVVWMPTYRVSVIGDIRNDSVLSADQIEANFVSSLRVLSRLATASRCGVFVKLHPMDALNSSDFPILPFVVVARANTSIFDELALYDVLAVADGIITDASSVCFDFMSTRRPILITCDFLNEYSRRLAFDVEALFSATVTCVDWKGADKFFDAVSSGDPVRGGAYEKFCEFNDAESSVRVLAALEVKGSRVDRHRMRLSD